MNDELQETLTGILEKTMDVAQTSGEWALDKAPELIQQFLMWELWSAVIGFIISCILLFFTGKIFFSIKRDLDLPLEDAKYREPYFNSEQPTFTGGFLGVVGIFMGILGTVFFIAELYTIVHILVAPDVYLIKTLLGK